jgi:death-on-curing protein
VTDEAAVDYLAVEDLVEIASGILDGLPLRDVGLLASAAARPQTTIFGSDAYPRFVDKAAALVHSLARNHPLVDGNKRLAWAALRTFCLLNGRDLTYRAVDDAEQFVQDIASGVLGVTEIAEWISNRLVVPADRSGAVRRR